MPDIKIQRIMSLSETLCLLRLLKYFPRKKSSHEFRHNEDCSSYFCLRRRVTLGVSSHQPIRGQYQVMLTNERPGQCLRRPVLCLFRVAPRQAGRDITPAPAPIIPEAGPMLCVVRGPGAASDKCSHLASKVQFIQTRPQTQSRGAGFRTKFAEIK